MKMLNTKQQEVYDFIVEFTASSGYPPSIREICAAVNLNPLQSMPTSRLLESRGYILKDDNKTRAILSPWLPWQGKTKYPYSEEFRQVLLSWQLRKRKGFSLDRGQIGRVLALRVRGQSMFNAGILDGDYVIASPADRQRRRHCRGSHRGRGNRKAPSLCRQACLASPREPRFQPDRR